MSVDPERDTPAVLAEYARKYPAMITYEHAVEISHCPLNTIYDWSSRGLFDGFKVPGRNVLLGRDAFVRFVIHQNQKRG